MSGASSSANTQSKLKSSIFEKDDVTDMMLRSKRSDIEAASPSLDDIYTFIHRPASTSSLFRRRPESASLLSNELFDELTATETSDVISSDVTTSEGGEEQRDNNGGGMKGIMSELKASKHHKLTRSDIRQLAKKAVILATLKKLKDAKGGSPSANSKISSTKPSSSTSNSKQNTKSNNKKHNSKKTSNSNNKRNKKKHHSSEKHSHVSASTAETVTTTDGNGGNEFSEDLSSHSPSKKSEDVLTDNDPALSVTDSSPSDISKKSNIGKLDDSVASMFDEQTDSSSDATKATVTSPVSFSSSGKTQLVEKVKSLRSFLAKADSTIIPLKFLPDLPSGLRMIGWKEMIDKKKKQLNELEATVGTVDDAASVSVETNTNTNKPSAASVSLNIDVDDPLSSPGAAKASVSADSSSPLGDLTDLTGDKKSEDPISLQHIGYLQRHIKGARSLRKLIARTLVGHCKSTGKRIFEAFVAMDKALARAQTIATVIGKKFNIDIDRIDALVGDKEDQVVETFLKDIFTKI